MVGCSRLAQIFQRYRLSAAGVIGDGDGAKGDIFGPDFFDEGFQLGDIHIALEGKLGSGIQAFFDHQVLRSPAAGHDVALRCVEMLVGGDVHAGFYQQ